MIAIKVDSGAKTTTEGKWDPRVNEVSYNSASFTSETADGSYSQDAAQRVARRVDLVAASQSQAHRK